MYDMPPTRSTSCTAPSERHKAEPLRIQGVTERIAFSRGQYDTREVAFVNCPRSDIRAYMHPAFPRTRNAGLR